jgi:hypothetical protein
MNALPSSAEYLVREIEAINRVWKHTRNLFGEDSALAASYRELKVCLQIQLLRTHSPEKVYLAVDSEVQGEVLYSLRLKQKIAGRLDAAHLPVRVAKDVLTRAEIERFTQH